MRIDSHLHVWQAATDPTPGIHTVVSPQTDVPIEMALDTLTEHNVERAVLVQPMFRGQDNSYVATCAREAPGRFAAVCVVDPLDPQAAMQLMHWVELGCQGLRLRPMVASEEAAFGDPATFPLWEVARRLNVVVSLLAATRHASAIDSLAERFAEVPIVIDHLAQPDVARGVDDPDFQRILALARHPNVRVKLSGFYHFSAQRYPFADCQHLLQAACDAFGPQRLLWGSDFPHVLFKCGYARSISVLDAALAGFGDSDRQLVLGLNAQQLYWPGD